MCTVGFGPEPPGLPARASSCRTRRATCRPRRRRSCAAPPTPGAAAALPRRRGALEARCPADALARAVFEALEQARVEALGARRMAGVAANLTAMLDEQYRRQGFERITERTESTMAEAVRLLTREALTDEPPPPAARKVVDLWRPWLEGKIAKDIAELDRAILDQDAYARATRRLIQDLDLDLGEMRRVAIGRQPGPGRGGRTARTRPRAARASSAGAAALDRKARPPTAPRATPRRTATPRPTAR